MKKQPPPTSRPWIGNRKHHSKTLARTLISAACFSMRVARKKPFLIWFKPLRLLRANLGRTNSWGRPTPVWKNFPKHKPSWKKQPSYLPRMPISTACWPPSIANGDSPRKRKSSSTAAPHLAVAIRLRKRLGRELFIRQAGSCLFFLNLANRDLLPGGISRVLALFLEDLLGAVGSRRPGALFQLAEQLHFRLSFWRSSNRTVHLRQ